MRVPGMQQGSTMREVAKSLKKRVLSRPLLLGLAAAFAVIIFIFNVLPSLFRDPLLERVMEAGELVVLTRNSPTTYYQRHDGPAGLEYDLAKGFADQLGVELRLVVPSTLNELLTGVQNGEGHLAAAGLTITEERKRSFRFTPSYQEITEQLIYNRENKRPRTLEEIAPGTLEVVAFSSHVDSLLKHKADHPEIDWVARAEFESEELLQLVSDNVVEYTIADSNEFLLNKRFLLNLRSAFDVSEPRQLAWVFPLSDDETLYAAASAYLERIRASGELDRLIERNYGHADNLDYVGTVEFRRHFSRRLPEYRELFQQAAEEHGLDWHLLAAVGYQESHWRPDAVSPTGVRGIMMLTQRTARELGIEDREDPASSIRGGAEYLAKTLRRIPDDIAEPDRTWMALAAYNVGFGHLEDARVITQQRGMDPHIWLDVKQSLPLLAQRKWYRNTRFGYARGWEPVRYVENIRSYYDLLRWLDEVNDIQPEQAEPDAFSILPQVP